MSLRSMNGFFAIAFLVMGIVGFIPFFVPNGLLLGAFQTDPILNVFYILSGVSAFLILFKKSSLRSYFQIFGILFSILTVFGFLSGNALAVMAPVNFADNILHAALSLIFLILGFGFQIAFED